jgi:hypothetical protein
MKANMHDQVWQDLDRPAQQEGDSGTITTRLWLKVGAADNEILLPRHEVSNSRQSQLNCQGGFDGHCSAWSITQIDTKATQAAFQLAKLRRKV